VPRRLGKEARLLVEGAGVRVVKDVHRSAGGLSTHSFAETVSITPSKTKSKFLRRASKTFGSLKNLFSSKKTSKPDRSVSVSDSVPQMSIYPHGRLLQSFPDGSSLLEVFPGKNNELGFEIGRFPNTSGVFIANVTANSIASILRVKDEILEIDQCNVGGKTLMQISSSLIRNPRSLIKVLPHIDDQTTNFNINPISNSSFVSVGSSSEVFNFQRTGYVPQSHVNYRTDKSSPTKNLRPRSVSAYQTNAYVPNLPPLEQEEEYENTDVNNNKYKSTPSPEQPCDSGISQEGKVVDAEQPLDL